MKLFRKILCKLRYHEEELVAVTVQPAIISRFPKLNNIKLPPYKTYMWVCRHCKKERIIFK